MNNAITTVGSNNQVTQTNVNGVTWTPGYDASGNLLSDEANQDLYDGEGRLCAVMASNPVGGGAVMTQYIYDADGNRVGKGTISTFSCNTASNGFSLTESYILGQSGEQVTELDGSGNFKHTNVYANGQLIATYDANGTTADPTPIHFQLSDWLGSRRVQTNYNGTVEYTFQNLPFGDTLVKTANPECSTGDQCFADDATEHHFTGKERDTESGNDYFGARYYASSMGRFIMPDWSAAPTAVPYVILTNPQSLNLYAYASNNPLTNADASGHVVFPRSQGISGTTLDNFIDGQENNSSEGPEIAAYLYVVAYMTQPQTGQDQQQQNDSSSGGGGFWHHVSNLFHGHSWNYVQATVTVTETDTVREPNEAVTAATDAAGLAGLAASEDVARVLGPVNAGVSIYNDRSPKNIITNGLGLIPGFDGPMAITGAFNDFLDFGINNSSPGLKKAYDKDQLTTTLPRQDGGCEVAGLPSC